MFETRLLETPTDGKILVQVTGDRHEMLSAISPHSLLQEVQRSLADKIAAQLFEAVSPVMISALRELANTGHGE